MLRASLVAAQQAANLKPLPRRDPSSSTKSQPDRHASVTSSEAASSANLQRIFEHAPSNYGLLITFSSECSTTSHSESDDTDVHSSCRMELVPDQHLGTAIHPNAYGPSSLHNLKVLSGGGSGVRVFQGTDPLLGSLVMKHGAYRDTQELFALATIAQQLQKRKALLYNDRKNNHGACSTENDVGLDNACHDMLSRIPEFKMIYVSPHHLTDKPRDLWRTLFRAVTSIRFQNEVVLSDPSTTSDSSNGGSESTTQTDSQHHSSDESTGRDGPISHAPRQPQQSTPLLNAGKRFHLYTTDDEKNQVQIHVHTRYVKIVLGSRNAVHLDAEELGYGLEYGVPRSKPPQQKPAPQDGYEQLKAFLNKMIPKQKENLWKFTQGQKTIGGPAPKTAFSYLAHGILDGDLLDTLIDEYLRVIRNLQVLTLPNEKDILEAVRREVDAIEKDVFARPCDVSDDLDSFVGFALKKNFDPDTGRFFVLRRMGKSFRGNKYNMTPSEMLPGNLLGQILREGTKLGDVYQGAPNVKCALDLPCSSTGNDFWRTMVRNAVDIKCMAGLERVWNCGIADGGLHNLFLDTEKVWFFDMGEPTLQPLPAFLTKFLFSFLHALGMVDDKSTGSWFNRFEPCGSGKIALTVETKTLMKKAYNAFRTTVHRLVDTLFQGEAAVKSLLIKYVTFQLLSDASFCLNKWTVKGGGRPRGTNHQTHLEKWLWRALWDLYIASDLNTPSRLQQLGVRST